MFFGHSSDYTNLSGANRVTRMFIDNGTGNVGIGTTSPTARLDVSGGRLAVQGNASDGMAVVSLGDATHMDGLVQARATLLIRGSKAPSSQGILFQTGAETHMAINKAGSVYVHGSIVHSSDARLKEDIQPIDSALNKIAMITGVSYNWIDKNKRGNRRQVGVTAQDVEKVFPELVTISEMDEGVKMVNYSGLIAPLIESVKQLKEENETLKIQAVTLKAQTAALKALICKDHQKAAIS